MSSILKVDQLQDSGGNEIITSNGSGTITVNSQTFKNGITMADQWRLTANITANVDPISANLERVDDASFSKIGTGMSVSSGIWSFPSTGIYQVGGVMDVQPGSNDNILIDCHVTTNNGGSYDAVWRINCGGATSLHRQGSNSTLVDVTDTSNVKVKFVAGSITSPSVILGDTDFNRTNFTFIRLGDT